jgi:hypothetical protein
MSKLLVAIYNATNSTLTLTNTEDSSNTLSIIANSFVRMQNSYNVPDNSDSSKYFAAHHMQIQDTNNQPLLSFWDDDSNNYYLFFCDGTNWQQTAAEMPGGNIAGDGLPVGLIITETKSAFVITACTVLNNV